MPKMIETTPAGSVGSAAADAAIVAECAGADRVQSNEGDFAGTPNRDGGARFTCLQDVVAPDTISFFLSSSSAGLKAAASPSTVP